MEEAGPSDVKDQCMSAALKLQIEKKRLKALELRRAKVLTQHPYKSEADSASRCQTRSRSKKNLKDCFTLPRDIDTGGGFLIEEDASERIFESSVPVAYDEGPVLAGDTAICDQCGKPFFESYLHTKYTVFICDTCKNQELDKHKLITKSDAKSKYLLQDGDIDRREPPLKYVLKKNPRNDSWGDMKLYYEPQVISRALEVWTSMDAIEKEKERRKVNRVSAKQKQFDKKMKELKMSVRGSLYRKSVDGHNHEYGAETCVDEERGEFQQTCATCGHVLVFEKL